MFSLRIKTLFTLNKLLNRMSDIYFYSLVVVHNSFLKLTNCIHLALFEDMLFDTSPQPIVQEIFITALWG